jgi:Glycosyl hydrolase family 79 C-terminal beta domain
VRSEKERPTIRQNMEMRGMSTLSRTTTSFLAVTLVAVAAAGVIAANRHASTARTATVNVEGATVGRPVPSGFTGLSMEFRGLATYAGQNPRSPSPVFEQLLRNLAPNQSPVLRVGGDGTDWTWYPVRNMTRPGGVKYNLTHSYLQVAKSLTQTLNARLILGINLEANSPRIAAAEGNAFVGQIGHKSIDALEIGNEPELYGSFSWFKAPDGQHVLGRPRSYNFGAFLGDFARMARALPNVPLAGPSSGSPNYIAHLGQFLHTEPRIAVVTLHRYPLKHCTKTSVVTMNQLLSDSAAQGLAASVASNVATANAHHAALRIDELNAISCGGERGVSDTFGSALWALDTLFAMARTGLDGVNFHTVPNTINELIGTKFARGHWQALVHPQYYGMMMFAQAAPAGSRLLRISGHPAQGVDAWATRSSDGHVRVVLINKGTSHAQFVKLRIASVSGPGVLERLRAPNVHSKSGVTLGGQSFGSKTTTGQLAGKQSTTTINSSGGSYTVSLPAYSAALLTLT